MKRFACRLFPVLLFLSCAGLTSVAPEPEPDNPKRVTSTRLSYPTWIDDSRILYESAVTGNWEIWILELGAEPEADSTIRQITTNDHLDRMPALSPDGRSIVFISDRDGDYEVFRMNADGSNPVQLTFNDVAEIHPYWSPDGTKIIFNRRVEGERLYEIRMMSSDGTDDESLLLDEELNSYAQISPDGRLVVFDKWQGNDETNGEIYLLSLEAGHLKRLTDNSVYDGYPAWFPDGERIVYASEVGDDFKLFTIRPDGSDRRQITFGPGSDARPSVSADGKRIVFNREIEGSINIWVLKVD